MGIAHSFLLLAPDLKTIEEVDCDKAYAAIVDLLALQPGNSEIHALLEETIASGYDADAAARLDEDSDIDAILACHALTPFADLLAYDGDTIYERLRPVEPQGIVKRFFALGHYRMMKAVHDEPVHRETFRAVWKLLQRALRTDGYIALATY